MNTGLKKCTDERRSQFCSLEVTNGNRGTVREDRINQSYVWLEMKKNITQC